MLKTTLVFSLGPNSSNNDFLQVEVNIDKHGSPSSTFDFTCQGREGAKRRFSVSTAQLALERGKVTRHVADLCQGGRVRVTYSKRYMVLFGVDSGTNGMVEPNISQSITYSAAWHSEILATFIQEHKLTPTFIDDNDTYPQYDEEVGEWTGAVGLVSI